jgi:hypothetical protein
MLREFNNLHKIADGVCAKLSLETLREIVYNINNQKSAKRRKKQEAVFLMKKTLAILLAMMMAFSAVALAVAADFDITQEGTEYTVTSPSTIEFVSIAKEGGKEVEMVPQGGCTIDALKDGELIRDASAYSTKGIVLIKNLGIGVDSDPELVPDYAFVMDFGAEVEFDTAYFTLYHEIATCIAIPGDKQVIVEVSEDGNVWAPVGDGIFYFNADVDEFENGVDDKEIVECAVYLGEEVSARYVRYTYTFMPVPEGGYWEWHTNIYEWCGFTEIGVAKWTGGEEPEVLGDDIANMEPTKVEGSWVGDDGVETKIMTFVNKAGVKTVSVTVYESEAYLENGIDAPVIEEYTATYSVVGNKLTLTYEDGSVDKMSATIDEEGDLTLGTGLDTVTYAPYEAPAPVEMSGVWYVVNEGAVTVVDFSTANVVKVIGFDAADFEENGLDGEGTVEEYTYTAGVNSITVDKGDATEKLSVSYNGENLVLGDLEYAPYVPKTPEVSEEESSEPEEESSEEPETSTEASTPATSAPAESSAATSDDGGDNTLMIVLIAVAAVVIIAAVVVLVIKRKK